MAAAMKSASCALIGGGIWLLRAVLLGLVLYMALSLLGSEAAYAQQGGGGGNAGGSGGQQIIQFIENIRDWLAAAVIAACSVGLLSSGVMKGFAGPDTHWQQWANFGIKGSIVGLSFGVLVGPIISMIQAFAGVGGGG
jgi:hypothetical protein